jgi:hypothetical protein
MDMSPAKIGVTAGSPWPGINPGNDAKLQGTHVHSVDQLRDLLGPNYVESDNRGKNLGRALRHGWLDENTEYIFHDFAIEIAPQKYSLGWDGPGGDLSNGRWEYIADPSKMPLHVQFENCSFYHSQVVQGAFSNEERAIGDQDYLQGLTCESFCIYSYADPFVDNQSAAMEYYNRAVSKGNAAAALRLGNIYESRIEEHAPVRHAEIAEEYYAIARILSLMLPPHQAKLFSDAEKALNAIRSKLNVSRAITAGDFAESSKAAADFLKTSLRTERQAVSTIPELLMNSTLTMAPLNKQDF